MTGRLVLRPQAEEDLIDIAAKIARDNPPAADRLVDRLAEKSRLLADFPFIGHRHRHARRPDLLCFAVGEYLNFYRRIPGGIEVVRYVHGRRDLVRTI